LWFVISFVITVIQTQQWRWLIRRAKLLVGCFADVLHTGNKTLRINVYPEITGGKIYLGITFFRKQTHCEQ
jgi:hypothetical protein